MKDNFSDALAAAWGLLMLLVVYAQWGVSYGLVVLVSGEGDLVVPPSCEACAAADPGSVIAWLCWLLGCVS